MNDLATAKEAWFVEAMGEFAQLLDRVELLTSALERSTEAQCAALVDLDAKVAAVEGRMALIAENVKVKSVRYLAVKTEEAARRLIEHQHGEIAEMTRNAFAVELGATMRRLQSALDRLTQETQRRGEQWLTHAAAVAVGSGLTVAAAQIPWK